MAEVLLAVLFGMFLSSLAPQRKKGSAPVQPIPPGKNPHPKDPGIVPPPNTPAYEQPEAPAEPPKGKATPEPVPNAYKPPGGWVPYMTPWTVQRATYYLGQPSILPTGSSITETDPKGVVVKFRAESGAAHGDPKLKRAVTAWRQQK